MFGRGARRRQRRPADALTQLCANMMPGADYEPEGPDVAAPAELPVRLIAYYLPQFHPIPENDLWWGKGFTEWTNVTRALPRYVGHYQPRLPGGLGFYDLRLPECLRAQALLARRYGISGFCFHYYWFSGRRLLDTPLEILLKHPEIEIPFCLNWANESWTRRWDGSEQMVLIRQAHSAEDDLAFARAVAPVLRDPRYLRIGGRPLIMLYRPRLLPDAAGTMRRWREHFAREGLGDPYLVMPQTFDDVDPRPFHMDAAAGFPPHRYGWDLPSSTDDLVLLDPRFSGRVMSYARLADAGMSLPDEEYKLFPGVCPGWDNEPRRPGAGVGFAGGSPGKYGAWLEHACRTAVQASEPDERIVFINAWNEWAEGAYLEPDRHYGYAYLRETARTLARVAACPGGKPAPGISDPQAPGSLREGRSCRLRDAGIRLRRRGAALLESMADAIRPD